MSTQTITEAEFSEVDPDLQDIDSTALSIIAVDNETPIKAVHRSLAIVKAINTMIDKVFVPEIHYGSIPGVKKPTLFLPGIESVMGLLSLHEEFIEVEVVRQYDEDKPFFYYEIECVLKTIGHNVVVGRGIGVAHSRESVYQRAKGRECPDCGETALMRSAYPPRNNPNAEKGWYCNKKDGGCGSNFDFEDSRIQSQNNAKGSDPQAVWDNVNNVKKKAKKRALADAVKRVGMLSSRFTADVEDMPTFSNLELGISRASQVEPPRDQSAAPAATSGGGKATAAPPAQAPPLIVPKNAQEGFLNTPAAREKLTAFLKTTHHLQTNADYQFILDHYKVNTFGLISIPDEAAFYQALAQVIADFTKPPSSAASKKKAETKEPKETGTVRVEETNYDGQKFIFSAFTTTHGSLRLYVYGRGEMKKLLGETWCQENGILAVEKDVFMVEAIEIEPLQLEYEIQVKKTGSKSSYGLVKKATPIDLDGKAISPSDDPENFFNDNNPANNPELEKVTS